MLTSLKLPDLVLGVSIRADTTGARQAARDLRNAVNREFGRAMGGPGGGGGGHGNVISNLLGPAMGGGVAAKQIQGVSSQLAAQARGIGALMSTSFLEPAAALSKEFATLKALVLSTGGTFKARTTDTGATLAEMTNARGQRMFTHVPMGKSLSDVNPPPMNPAAQIAANAAAVKALTTPEPWRFGDWRNGPGGQEWRMRQAQIAKELGHNVSTAVTGGAAKAVGGIASNVAKGVDLGTLKGFKNAFRSIRSMWHLLSTVIVGTMIIGTMKTLFKYVMSASRYIKASGLGGEYGEFNRNLYIMRALLANISIQFGLMLIAVFKLGDVFESLEPVMIRTASLFQWIAESPRAQILLLIGAIFALSAAMALFAVVAALAFFALLAMAGVSLVAGLTAFVYVLLAIVVTLALLYAGLVAIGSIINKIRGQAFFAGGNKQVLGNALEWIMSFIPEGAGGIAGAGAGMSTKMGGAMLEGSVEAYRTIQGTMMRYAAETAKNTRETTGVLREILNRGADMGVVAG